MLGKDGGPARRLVLSLWVTVGPSSAGPDPPPIVPSAAPHNGLAFIGWTALPPILQAARQGYFLTLGMLPIPIEYPRFVGNKKPAIVKMAGFALAPRGPKRPVRTLLLQPHHYPSDHRPHRTWKSAIQIVTSRITANRAAVHTCRACQRRWTVRWSSGLICLWYSEAGILSIGAVLE